MVQANSSLIPNGLSMVGTLWYETLYTILRGISLAALDGISMVGEFYDIYVANDSALNRDRQKRFWTKSQ